MTLTKYHPPRDLSVAKVRQFFHCFSPMEKTRQTCGKKSEDPSSSLHCIYRAEMPTNRAKS